MSIETRIQAGKERWGARAIPDAGETETSLHYCVDNIEISSFLEGNRYDFLLNEKTLSFEDNENECDETTKKNLENATKRIEKIKSLRNLIFNFLCVAGGVKVLKIIGTA